jgi:hypothetical protein
MGLLHRLGGRVPRRRCRAQPRVGLGRQSGDGAALVLGNDDQRVLQLAPDRRRIRHGMAVVLDKWHACADQRRRNPRAHARADSASDVGADRCVRCADPPPPPPPHPHLPRTIFVARGPPRLVTV